MGKASRAKRERREHPTPEVEHRRRPFPVFWTAIVVLIASGVAAAVLTAPDDRDRAAEAKAKDVPAFADVIASSDVLPVWTDAEEDPAEGELVPDLRGTNFDGDLMRLSSRSGSARVYVFVAHWCPHCRDEVPRIVEWAKNPGAPAGVEIVTVSTAASSSRDNFPPAEWLAREGWPYEVLIDDEVGTAAEAFGLEGFPFIVFADRSGQVVRRYSGEMPIDEFDVEVRRLVD